MVKTKQAGNPRGKSLEKAHLSNKLKKKKLNPINLRKTFNFVRYFLE